MRKHILALAALLIGSSVPMARAAAARPARDPGGAPRLDRTRRLLLLDLPAAREVEVAPDPVRGGDPYTSGVTVEALGGIAPAVRAALRHDLAGLEAGAGCPADQRLAGLLAPRLVQEALGPGWEAELGVAGPPEDVLETALPELAAEVARRAGAKGSDGLDALAFLVSMVLREPAARRDHLASALGLKAAVERLAKAYQPAPRRQAGTRGKGDGARAARIYEALCLAGRKPAAPAVGDEPRAIAAKGLGDFAAGAFDAAEAEAARLAAMLEGRDAWVRLGSRDLAAVAAAIDLFGRMDSSERWGRAFEEGLLEVSAGPLATGPRGYRERYVLAAAAARLLARFHGHGRDGPPLQVEVTCGPSRQIAGTGPDATARSGRSFPPRVHLSPADLAAGHGRIRLVPRSGEAITIRLGWWGE